MATPKNGAIRGNNRLGWIVLHSRYYEFSLLTIKYSAELCGAGKTWWACRHIAQKIGRYLLVVDRRNIFSDRIKLIEQFAAEIGTAPEIVPIFSASGGQSGGVHDVRRVVREAGCEQARNEHVVVLVTHEALKSSDLSTYRDDWHCIIDEVPTVWTHSEVVSSALHLYLKEVYTLESLAGTDWSELRVKTNSPLLTDIYADTALSGWAEVHRQIRDRGAIAKIKSWEEGIHPVMAAVDGQAAAVAGA